jgi:hypothetical protein
MKFRAYLNVNISYIPTPCDVRFDLVVSQLKEEAPPPSPPSVTITGVRIPADGAPAHLVQLNTISASDATDGFLFHVADLRKYWRTDLGWHQRNLLRLDLQQDRYADFIPLSQHLR